jgi:hypothetical protein
MARLSIGHRNDQNFATLARQDRDQTAHAQHLVVRVRRNDDQPVPRRNQALRRGDGNAIEKPPRRPFRLWSSAADNAWPAPHNSQLPGAVAMCLPSSARSRSA